LPQSFLCFKAGKKEKDLSQDQMQNLQDAFVFFFNILVGDFGKTLQ